MNIKKMKILMIFIIALICINSGIMVFADEIETKRETNSIFVDNGTEIDDGIPEVSTDEIAEWADRKGFEIVGLLQRFVQPFSIVIFIGCAILALMGAFGNGRLVSTGLLGMVISLVIYAVVLYAPEIMDGFLSWVKS